MRQHSTLQLRRGNLDDFRTSQLVLSEGEPCFIIDYNTVVVGDGQSTVDELHPSPTEVVKVHVKNTSGNTILQATPVYITGVIGATDTLQVAPADASDALKMPSIGILEEDLENDAFGHAIVGGILKHVKDTAQIDGNPSVGSILYVKAGGGLTATKPTGVSNLIQNVGKVGKISGGNSGSIIVSSIMRTNDVPNAVSCETVTIGDYRLQEESGNLILVQISTGQKYNFDLTPIP